MAKGNILFFDEHYAIDPLADIFNRMGYNTQIIEPSPRLGPEDIVLERTPNALIYEPYFAMRDLRHVMRPALDRLIQEARSHKAKIVVLTTQEESAMRNNNIINGVHYDYFLQKPEQPEEILRVLGL